MRNKNSSFMVLIALSLAALLSGCGSSNKEGGSTGAAALESEASCKVCHVQTLDGQTATNILADYATSGHNPLISEHASGCQGCHGGGSQHNGVGPIAYPNPLKSDVCVTCHKGDYGVNNNVFTLAAESYKDNCSACHNRDKAMTPGPLLNSGSLHGIAPLGGCLDCHSIDRNETNIPQHNPNAATNDKIVNAGVRAVTAEFNKNSHHVTGRAITNADCAVCHLAGKVVHGNIAVDPTKHMTDGITYLRNGGGVSTYTETEFAWNPANPDHNTMDKFCMSCHNANGAPKAVNIVAGNSAKNPFNSGLTNSYDTLVRPAVVAVYEQFDPANTAHHAVRGAKYSVRTRTAAFSNNSSAALPGVRKTIFDAGLFVKDYTPLGATLSVADNSVLHCGDCHTVGQFKPGSTTNDKGVATTVVIGAHGSNNEYMLRNASGADALHHQSDNASAVAAEDLTGHTADNMLGADGTYVCFLCHAQTLGETGGYNAMGFHAGMEGSNISYCNGRAAESVGLTGFGGTFKTTYDVNGVKTGQTRVPNIIGTSSNGNVFGYSCAHCHNAGQNNTFGGIHGGKATYMSYSGSGIKTAFVQKKPYRFTGGLSLRYNGGGDDSTRWENNAKFDKSRREGCYNQSTASLGSSPTSLVTRLWGPGTRTDEFGTVDTIPANPTGSNGTWGSCAHHNGQTTAGSGTQPTRAITRPLSY